MSFIWIAAVHLECYPLIQHHPTQLHHVVTGSMVDSCKEGIALLFDVHR